MLAKTSTIACVLLGTSLFAARAHAQAEPETEAKPAEAAAAGDEGTDQLTLPKGRALLDAFIEINLSDGGVFKPFSVSPDVWYGVTDDITAGLVHSAAGSTGFIGGFGQSLCLSGSGDGGCGNIYDNVGLDGRYKLKLGDIAFAAEGGLYLVQISDPLQLAIKLGAVGRWHSGKLAVEAAPNLFLGLTNRDAGTPDVLNLPATVFYAITPMISAAVQTGFIIPFKATGDTYAIPLSIGAHYHVNESLNVSLAFSLPALITGLPVGGFDVRSLTLGGTYAL